MYATHTPNTDLTAAAKRAGICILLLGIRNMAQRVCLIISNRARNSVLSWMNSGGRHSFYCTALPLRLGAAQGRITQGSHWTRNHNDHREHLQACVVQLCQQQSACAHTHAHRALKSLPWRSFLKPAPWFAFALESILLNYRKSVMRKMGSDMWDGTKMKLEQRLGKGKRRGPLLLDSLPWSEPSGVYQCNLQSFQATEASRSSPLVFVTGKWRWWHGRKMTLLPVLCCSRLTIT